jgi:ubiquinone/menaquinone biosynthesis C-methylase UbiE
VPLLVDPDGIETEAIRELVVLEGASVVELGCGDGRITFRYAAEAARVLAFDTDEDAIRTADAAVPEELRDRLRFEVAHAAEIELPTSEFDLALFSWSL